MFKKKGVTEEVDRRTKKNKNHVCIWVETKDDNFMCIDCGDIFFDVYSE